MLDSFRCSDSKGEVDVPANPILTFWLELFVNVHPDALSGFALPSWIDRNLGNA